MLLSKIIRPTRLISKCHFTGLDMVWKQDLCQLSWHLHSVNEKSKIQLHGQNNMRKAHYDPDFSEAFFKPWKWESPSPSRAEKARLVAGWVKLCWTVGPCWVSHIRLDIKWFTRDTRRCLIWDTGGIQACVSSLDNDGRAEWKWGWGSIAACGVIF